MSLTPDEIEAERERFEAWWAKRWGNGTKPEREGNGYWSGPAFHAWYGWIAAIESERERVRKASGELTLDEALNICGIERSENDPQPGGQNREDDAGDQGV